MALSVKSGIRQKRCRPLRPIRQCIQCRSVPLPGNWLNYLAMPENKADIAAYPSVQISTVTYGDRDAVVADGFVDEDNALSTAGSYVSTSTATKKPIPE